MTMVYKRTRYGVWRVNDDGRRELWCSAANYNNAALLASAFRDESTEDEIAQGWNYLPMSSKIDTKSSDSRTRNKE